MARPRSPDGAGSPHGDRPDRPRLSIYASALRLGSASLALGLGGGAALGAALSRVMRSWLGSAAPDPIPVYGGAAVLLAVVTLAAVTLAARRALRVTPARLLTAAE